MKERNPEGKGTKQSALANSPHYETPVVQSFAPPPFQFATEPKEEGLVGENENQAAKPSFIDDGESSISPTPPNEGASNPNLPNSNDGRDRNNIKAFNFTEKNTNDKPISEPRQNKAIQLKFASGQNKEISSQKGYSYTSKNEREQALPQKQNSSIQAKSVIQKQDPNTEQRQTVVAPTSVPAGGTDINKVGIVNWSNSPELKLRATASTTEDNIIGYLEFNTRLEIIKEFSGGWYFVSLANGKMGYTSKNYVWDNLPEPNAILHRVQNGVSGTAIAIAEQYFQSGIRLGQDLRFYVSAIAHVNNMRIPSGRDGWRGINFEANSLIWIPSLSYARGLSGLLESGSITYDTLDAVGLGGIAQSADQKWRDFKRAIALSGQYIPAALGRHALRGLQNALVSVALLILGAALLLGLTTGIGALIGNAPGAAIGFKVGMFLIKWLGLAMLIHWIGTSLVRIGGAFLTFILTIWNADGDPAVIDRGAQELAEALGVVVEVIIEGLVMLLAARGLSWISGRLAGSRFGERIGLRRLTEWMRRQGGRETNSGETGEQPFEVPRPNPSETVPTGMSEGLAGIRSRLRDPKAIEQFDLMFERMRGESARMQRAIDGMRNNGRSLEQRLVEIWDAAHPTPRGASLSEVPRVKSEAELLLEEVNTFGTENSGVRGVRSWVRAIRGELSRLNRMREGQLEATPESVQGARNNIKGIEAELRIAQAESGVIGVSQRFSLNGRANRVEVDVVANQGRTWIESKNVEPFGRESSNWRNIESQAREMMTSARQNPVNGNSPRVVWEFQKGVTREIAGLLRAIGIEVRGPISDAAPMPIPVLPGNDDED